MLPPAVTTSPTLSGGLLGWPPAAGWLRGYQRAWLRGDLMAGLGCQLQIVEARASVRDVLHLEGVEETVGNINRFTSVADAVEEFLEVQLRESMN